MQADLPTFLGSTSVGVKKWKPIDCGKQKELTDAVVSFVASDLQPLSVVESPAFRKLLEKAEPRYTMPSRKHLSSKLIPKCFEELYSKIVVWLQRAPRVCLTLDIWTNRQMRSYLGMTAHFIIDFSLKSVMLACRRFQGRHTGEEILLHFSELEQLFQITGRVDNIVTDSGSNMLKAFRLLEISNEANDDSDTIDIDEEDDLQPVEIDTDLCNELDMIKPHHYPCFAHTLQLVVKDGLEKADQVKRVLGKVSKLVNHVRHSTVASNLFEGHNRLQIANATRWNSQLTMLNSLLQVCNSPAMQQLDFSGKLNVYEIGIVKDLIEILTPFKWATDLTQGENKVTASIILPVICGLDVQIGKLCEKFDSRLTRTLKSSFERRMFKYKNEEKFKLAAVLDPRWKMAWCTENESEELKHIILGKLQASSSRPTTNSSTEEATTVSLEGSPLKKRSKLFEFMDSSNSRPQTSDTIQSILLQVDEYLTSPTLSEDEDPLTFWKTNQHRFPDLSTLACNYLQTPASSGPVERLFSIAGKIFRPERCRLSDELFEKLMFIRSNQFCVN